jgi:hypothetical protein
MSDVRSMRLLARLAVGYGAVRLDEVTSNAQSTTFRIDGTLAKAPTLIYAHYSSCGTPLPYEEAALRQATQSGLQVVSVVSAPVHRVAPSQWREFSQVVISRRSAGRDLGAFRDALASLFRESGALGHPLHMTNDSVLWFPDAFTYLADRAGVSEFDLTSATDSIQPFWHLQSYWLTWRRGVDVDAVKRVFSVVRNFKLRQSVVSLGELRLADGASRAGLTCGAIWPIADLHHELSQRLVAPQYGEAAALQVGQGPRGALRNHSVESGAPFTLRYSRYADVARRIAGGQSVNPSHFLWDLLLDSGFPGLKRDLLTRNPSQVEDWIELQQHPRVLASLSAWPQVVAPRPGVTDRFRRWLRF